MLGLVGKAENRFTPRDSSHKVQLPRYAELSRSEHHPHTKTGGGGYTSPRPNDHNAEIADPSD